MKTRYTDAPEKLFVSIVNLFTIFIVSIPFLIIYGFTLKYRILLVILFFVQDLIYIFFFKNKYLGMKILNAEWEKQYSLKRKLLYSFLYTLSFSTFLIWIFFPFDLLIFNILCIQLPCVLITGKTLHGYLAGMVGVKKG
jgi:hypothetical protein